MYIRGILIRPDGTTEDRKFSFESCRAAVGGYVQCLKLAENIWAYVNEDGLPKGLPVNPLATKLWVVSGCRLSLSERGVVGPVVVVGANGTKPIHPTVLKLIEELKAAHVVVGPGGEVVVA